MDLATILVTGFDNAGNDDDDDEGDEMGIVNVDKLAAETESIDMIGNFERSKSLMLTCLPRLTGILVDVATNSILINRWEKILKINRTLSL